jgi:hypothetical protein
MMNVQRMNAWRGALLLLCSGVCPPLSLFSQSPETQPHHALIAWQAGATGVDSLDQLSLEAIFGSVGLQPERISPEESGGVTPGAGAALIVPHAAAAGMSDEVARRVVANLEDGLVLVTDGMSPLAGMLGIRLGRPEYVEEVVDHVRPEVRLLWPGHQLVHWIAEFPGSAARPVYSEKRQGHPLAIILGRGRGQCLYSAPLVDPRTDKGYSRFSTLPSVIAQGLGCHPLISRRGADAYFDPGYRFGRPAETLARMWRSWGITGVHVAAWYASGTPPYDYAGLIEALHRNGVLAYAWLEWPYVGKGFWDSHPGWRQKNALLQDAHLDFLYLMDLQNPACMAAALKELEELLALDWDGVDVAEFTLTGAGREALEGPAMPEFFTGFTETGRREFSKHTGFDPLELFNPRSRHYWKTDTSALKSFYRYRTSVNYGSERMLFDELRKGDREKKRSREMMLTIVDNTLHPEFDDLLGFDMNETVALTQQFGLTLNVEDPYTEWSRPPDRYTAMRANYRRLLGGSGFMIDVNVVPLEEDRKAHFPTAQAAGTEFLQLWHFASGETGRVCFYCESSVYEKDWQLLPFAMARRGNVTTGPGTFTVDAPYTVTLRSEHGKRRVRLDGELWPARGDSEITVPAGKHLIRIDREGDAEGVHLVSITGELIGARWSGDSLTLEYQSVARCALGFDAMPGAVILDGGTARLSFSPSERGCVVLAPPGRHTLTVTGP